VGVQNASVVEGSPEFVVITMTDADPDFAEDHLGNDRMNLKTAFGREQSSQMSGRLWA
jgi:hypothetical protein